MTKTHLPIFLILTVFLCADAKAQLLSDRFFLEGGISASLSTGDRGFDHLDYLDWVKASSGWGSMVGLGLTLSDSYDIVGKWSRGTFPGLNTNEPGLPHVFQITSKETRASLQLEFRYRMLPFGTWEPIPTLAGVFSAGLRLAACSENLKVSSPGRENASFNGQSSAIKRDFTHASVPC